MTDWRVPLADRKRLAWSDIREIARKSIQAGQSLRESGTRRHYRNWLAIRGELAHALRVWSAYRDWIDHQRRPRR